MDSPVFDAMLKTALEEALRRDIGETPEAPAPSWRQRRRMRALLNREGGQGPEAALSGEWTLAITLRPAKVLWLEPERFCLVNGADWVLESIVPP